MIGSINSKLNTGEDVEVNGCSFEGLAAQGPAAKISGATFGFFAD